VVAWVWNTASKDGTIFSRADGAVATVRQFQLYTTDAANQYLAVNVGGVVHQSATRLSVSRFYHVAAVVTTGGVTLYLDGSPVADVTNASIGTAMQNTTAKIGARNPGEGFPFEGWIDDVQVYSHALSGAEIAYLRTHPGKAVVPQAGSVITIR
jgi:hypothetical protein